MSRNVIGLVLLSVLLVLSSVGISLAQESPAKNGSERSAEELWSDLQHYIRIGKADLAMSFSGKLLLLIDSGDLKPSDVYQLSQKPKHKGSELILIRGKKLEGLSDNMTKLLKIIETGYQDMRGDPKEISRMITLLGGSLENYTYARHRLAASGELALSQLMRKLIDVDIDQTLRTRIITTLPAMGKDAVRGLSAALATKDQSLLLDLANILREIEYPHCTPRLAEALARKDLLPQTKIALQRALLVCGGKIASKISVSKLFYEWAEKYYAREDSLQPNASTPNARVWYWVEGLGLKAVSVPREILCTNYAMRFARIALEKETAKKPENQKAVSLWLCAISRRKLDLPANTKAPILLGEMLQPNDYILATSPRYLQQSLARALSEKNAALVMMMIQGLTETATGPSLLSTTSDGDQPLVEALKFTEQNVHYLAAISLAEALPQKKFRGAEQVMSVLIDAINQKGENQAAPALWASRACKAVERLADTKNQAFNFAKAIPALIDATKADKAGFTAIYAEAASCLAVMDDATAQQAIANLALNSGENERLAIETFDSLCRSLRRFGYKLKSDQAKAVIKLVISAESKQLRTATSRALGAMNLPSEEIKQLILSANND